MKYMDEVLARGPLQIMKLARNRDNYVAIINKVRPESGFTEILLVVYNTANNIMGEMCGLFGAKLNASKYYKTIFTHLFQSYGKTSS